MSKLGDRNIDQYATIIHENYEQFKPGEKTLAKMAANPGKVGSHFLTRAAMDNEEPLNRNLIEAVTHILSSYQS